MCRFTLDKLSVNGDEPPGNVQMTARSKDEVAKPQGIVEKGVHPIFLNQVGNSPFLKVCCIGEKQLPAADFSLDESGSEELVRLFLGRGANLAYETDKRTALIVTVQNTHVGVVQLLLERGCQSSTRQVWECVFLDCLILASCLRAGSGFGPNHIATVYLCKLSLDPLTWMNIPVHDFSQ